MIRTLFLILIAIVTFNTNCLSQFDTVYFDYNWDTTSKNEAQYYRTPMIETDSGYLFKDYYISGELQFDGFTLEPAREILHGTVKYYYEEGGLEKIKSYKNGKGDGEEIAFLKNGKEMSRGINRNDTVVQGTFLYNYIQYHNLITVENTTITKSKVFDIDNLEGASYTVYLSDGNMAKVDYYGNRGEFLGTGDSLVFESVFNGVRVEYYYEPMRVESISTMKNGSTIGSTKSYFVNGKIKSIDYFEPDDNGNSQYAKSVYFTMDGKRLDSLLYRDGSAWKGTQCFYYMNFNNETSLYRKTPYEKGLIHGTEQVFFDNGNLKEENEYSEGKIHGKYVRYSEDGTVIAYCQMRDGEPYNGEIYGSSVLIGYKNGERKYEKYFYSSGELQSEQIFADGHMTTKYFNKDGSEIGTFEDKYMHENGVAVSFMNDTINSKRYFNDGELMGEQMFINNILVEDVNRFGESKFYDFVNNVTYQCLFKDGIPWEGVIADITPEGLSGYIEYKDGRRNGKNINYRYSFKTQSLYISSEETYFNEAPHGLCKYYSESGKLREITYEYGMYHGPAQFYDFEGNLLSAVEYNMNRVVNGKCYSYSDDYISASETYASEFLIMEEEYYPNSKLVAKKRITYDSLSPQMTVQLFYENGETKEEWEKQYNSPHGSYLAFLPNGAVLAKGQFENGLPKSGTIAYFHGFEDRYQLLKIEDNRVLLETYHEGSLYNSETYSIDSKDNFQDRMNEIMEHMRSENYAYNYYKG